MTNFLLSTEIIPLCLRTMEMGSELSKTVATFIVQKILLDEARAPSAAARPRPLPPVPHAPAALSTHTPPQVGLSYICATPERCYAVGAVLANMVTTLVRLTPPPCHPSCAPQGRLRLRGRRRASALPRRRASAARAAVRAAAEAHHPLLPAPLGQRKVRGPGTRAAPGPRPAHSREADPPTPHAPRRPSAQGPRVPPAVLPGATEGRNLHRVPQGARWIHTPVAFVFPSGIALRVAVRDGRSECVAFLPSGTSRLQDDPTTRRWLQTLLLQLQQEAQAGLPVGMPQQHHA